MKKEDKIIEEGLNAIYGSEEKVDFTKLERGRGRLTSVLLTVVVTLAVVALLSWGAFFVYNRYFADTTEDVFALSIETPNEIVSGETAQIVIQYENMGNVPLASLELDISLPSTFVIRDLAPTPANQE